MAQESKQTKVRRVDFYADDWIAGTVGMTHEERSIYISVCAAIWSTGGPVEEAYVRQICGGGHFSRGLARLVAKGKIIPTRSQLGPNSSLRLTQLRAEKELTRAQLRAESSQTNGAKGGRPKSLEKPDGEPNNKPNNKPNGLISTRARRSTTTIIKNNLSSSVGEVAARAPQPAVGAVAPRDDEHEAAWAPDPNQTVNGAHASPETWNPLGSILGDPPPPPEPDAYRRNARIVEHLEFLHSHGSPQDIGLYNTAIMSDDPEAAQRIFNATEEWMTEENCP